MTLSKDDATSQADYYVIKAETALCEVENSILKDILSHLAYIPVHYYIFLATYYTSLATGNSFIRSWTKIATRVYADD